jgi:hypothetical protein
MTLDQIAQALGGRVSSGQVLAPGPGHSAQDRSLSIRLSDSAPDGFVVFSHSGDDVNECRDHVRGKLGLPPWHPNGKGNGHPPPRATANGRAAASTPRVIAVYDYTDAEGKLLYQVQRLEPKTFRQRRPDGRGGWITSNVFEGVTRVPYRWPELAIEMAAYPDAPIFCTEGEKDCDRVRGLGLFATCVAGSVWTPEIAAMLKGRDIILLEDNDKAGRENAGKAGQALRGVANSIRVVSFAELPEKCDVSDWIEIDPQRHNAEALAARCHSAPLLDPAKAGAPSERARFNLVRINDIVLGDDPLWLIDDIIPAGPSLGVIFGQPKAGKSFVTADMLLHIAMGRSYCGRDCLRGAVVYVTSEGIRGFDRRMVAMRRHYGIEHLIDLPFYVTHEMPKLGTESGDAALLAQNIRAVVPAGVPIAAVIIDTLARAMTGASDSDSRDMSVFVSNCDTVARTLKCFVGAIHHSPRGDFTRARGSNLLDGSADVLISVVKGDEGISTVTVEELKDGDAGLAWRFRVLQVGIEVGENRNKKSCFAGLAETISRPARNDPTETIPKQKLSATQRRFFEILCEAVVDLGGLVPGSPAVPPGIKAVTRDHLKKCLLERGFLDREKPDAARSIFSRTLNDLAGKHVIGTTAEHVWLPK